MECYVQEDRLYERSNVCIGREYITLILIYSLVYWCKSTPLSPNVSIYFFNKFVSAYLDVGSGRCAGWYDTNWIMTSDAESETDRGSDGKSVKECQAKCSATEVCRYAISDGNWCYIWKGLECSARAYGSYNIYKKNNKGDFVC